MSTHPKPLYEFGPYRLHTAERLLLRNGEPVPLTPKAFETLVALVERSGHLVEKDELMKVVWSESFVEESNLTNNVYALRKLLGQDENSRSYIETVPKRGYRFAARVKELSPEALVVEKRTLTRVVTEETVADDSPQKRLIGAVEALAIGQARVHMQQSSKWPWLLVPMLSLSLVIGGIFIHRSLTASRSLTAAPPPQIESIAVLPFKNESGNPDVEYLSDGVTESLINKLSLLPNLSVKARSSVFRYKDKEVDPQRVAAELNVQAVLNGRVVQRGDDLALYLSLVDGRNGNQLWGEQYNRKLTNLVAMQNEIARDVSHKLRARLSGADEQRLAKNYTHNSEAYQLYLKGRYHVSKITPTAAQKGTTYFQQAIDVDPSYALAYVGLANAYRVLALNGDVPSAEMMSKAKAAAQKAVTLDDALAAAHAVLGFTIFWYDWDWTAAEKEVQRALELDPNDAAAYLGYAHLNSNLERHERAIALSQRAIELDPLWLMANSLQAQFLFYAGRHDEAIVQEKKTLELEPNFWHPHLILSNIYLEKGMFAQAITEGRKAKDLSGGSAAAIATIGCALAKSGKRDEARGLLHELEKRRPELHVSPYNFALIYNGLGERDETLAWLERGIQQRDPRMVFLKVEPRWNNLRDDPRFQDLLRRIGLL